YQSIIKGSKAIYSRLRMLSKMNFPMSVIPNFVIFSNFYIHLFLLVISIVIFHFMGYHITIYYLQFIYFIFSLMCMFFFIFLIISIVIFHFMRYHITIYYLQFIYFIFATMCMLFATSLITSTLSTIVRDFLMFLNSTLRMLLYMSGVLWPITLLDDFPLIMKLMMFNPLFYLIEGYRAAFFGTEWYFITHWQYSLYFWGLVILLLLVGSALHVKFRRHFIDYL